MKVIQLSLCVCWAAVTLSAAASNPERPPKTPASPDTYGSASVSRIISIEPDGTLVCNIDAFPPVIGRHIRVVLEGIEHPAAGAVDKDVLAFLQDILMPKSSDPSPSIELKDIRRGQSFCLVANIEVDGKDLARLLVEKGLAQRIIRLESSETAPPSASPSTGAAPSRTAEPAAPAAAGYVAAKSSKVFHRADCPHAKRLNPATTQTFRTRHEAEQNGRRPCKTCSP